jgi:hypothetical protein
MSLSLFVWELNQARPLVAQALIDGNFESLVDPKLEKNYDHEEMKRMIACAGVCMHFFAEKRPHMSEVCAIFFQSLIY